MKIQKFKYFDKSINWSLNEVNFEKLTLLVGASGVGKTQILNSIMNLRRISSGKSLSGIHWDITFQTLDKSEYRWLGEFENKGEQNFIDEDDEESKKHLPKILSESLFLNDNEIIKRLGSDIFFEGNKTVKLSQQQSALYMLREESLVLPAFQGFKKVIYSDQSFPQREPFGIKLFDVSKLLNKLDTLEKIKESDEDIRVKLFLTYKNQKDVFSKIVDRFIDIFPQVENVKVEPIESEEDMPFFFKDYPFVQIKEKGIDKWIKQSNISSGMFRSLMHISEIYLSSDGTVFLIDEFENSLGVNCIDELTSDILNSPQNIQFILTSHHPYIINSIKFQFWKIVTRKQGVVNTYAPEKLQLGKSKHDAFMQLIQLEEYQTGIEN